MEEILNNQVSTSVYSQAESGAVFVDAVSPSMQAVEAVIRELAHSVVPVLLIGEKGTGKRTIAERIYRSAERDGGRFVVEPCLTLTPEKLKTSAFPGVTFYLEEICDLNEPCQEALLEILTGVANHGNGPHDVRVICGSSHDVEGKVRSREFREDLYYRLSGVCLRIPPLRQRKEDLPTLISFFLSRHSHWLQRPVPTLSDKTLQLFNTYSWPGNLSELDAAVRAIVAVGDESVAMGGLRSLLTRVDTPANRTTVSLKDAARAASREAEKELILRVLNRTRWNRRRAAQELQISYKALLYKLKQIGYSEYGAT
jgi:two-component system response regulator AtoC